MKERASFTFDKETIKILDELVLSGDFRNRSHVVEHAIKALGEGKAVFPAAISGNFIESSLKNTLEKNHTPQGTEEVKKIKKFLDNS